MVHAGEYALSISQSFNYMVIVRKLSRRDRITFSNFCYSTWKMI